jgi:hypothetical protein
LSWWHGAASEARLAQLPAQTAVGGHPLGEPHALLGQLCPSFHRTLTPEQGPPLETPPAGSLARQIRSVKGEGRQNKKTEKTTYICASSQKKVRTCHLFLFFFSAFLGVSRQGSSKTREKKLSTFQKKSPGKVFFGAIFFPGEFF